MNEREREQEEEQEKRKESKKKERVRTSEETIVTQFRRSPMCTRRENTGPIVSHLLRSERCLCLKKTPIATIR